MRRPAGFQRVRMAAQALGAAVLLMTVGLPHHHDGSAAPSPAHACRACKIQDGFSATPPVSQALPALPALVGRPSRPAHDSPRAARVVRHAASRAPPRFS